MRPRPMVLLVVLVLAAGMAWRIAASAWFACDLSPRYAQAVLLSRHMAADGVMRATGYGPGAPGAFEPAWGAILARVAGGSEVVINLATALVGGLVLVVLAAWARDAGGRAAGLAAGAFAAVGPPVFFRATSQARGGLAVLLLCSALVPWLTVRIVTARRRGQLVSRGVFAGLGLAAGIGWWTHPVAAAPIAAAGLIWVLGLGRGCLWLRGGYAVLGFGAGSLPWWLSRGGGTASGMWQALAWDPAAAAAALASIPDGLGLWKAPGPRAAGLVLYAVLAGLAAVRLVLQYRRRQYGRLAALGAAWGLAAAGMAVAGAAEAEPVVLVIMPALAVCVGVATAALNRRLAWGLGWVPLLLLMAPHLQDAAALPSRHRLEQRARERAVTLLRALADEGTEAVYAAWDDPAGGMALNLAAGPGLVVGDPVDEPCPLIAAALADAGTVAVVHDAYGFSRFLANAGGRARSRERWGYTVHDRLAPPADNWIEIMPALWRTVRDGAGRDVRHALTDRVLASGVVLGGRAGGVLDLVTTWDAPRQVAGFRVRLDAGVFRGRWEVARRAPDGRWVRMARSDVVTPYFWSGPYPMAAGPYYRLEGRFTEAPAECVRLRLWPAGGEAPRRVAELQWFGPGAPRGDDGAALEMLAGLLEQRGIRRLYCEPGLARRLAARPGEALVTTRDPRLVSGTARGLSPAARIEPWTGMLVRAEDAPMTREVLARRGCAMRETRAGPWVLFDLVPGAWGMDEGPVDGLRWVGYGCLAP